MRAINHALTGAVLGLLIDEPVIAGAAAVLSHFVCDAIPHYGTNRPNDAELKSQRFTNSLYLDALACFVVVVVLAVTQPQRWMQAALCAFLAAAPDFLSITRFLHIRKGKKWRPSMYSKFAGGIQWFERPIGAVVEIAWFVAGIVLLMPLVQ